MKSSFFALLSRNKIVITLSFYWLIATLVNITKAVHIDDTQYVEVARLIARDPMHPFTSLINWFDVAEPVHEALIHPPLISYIYAFFIWIFGVNEIVLHLIISFFTLLCIIFFYRLADIISPRFALLTTGLLILGPAFLPSQNLMIDIPILSVWLCFFYFLFLAERTKKPFWYFFSASLMIGISALMKYSGILLIPFLLLGLFQQKRLRYIFVLILPVGMLVLWSIFNLWEYGGVHLLEISKRNTTQIYSFFGRGRPWILDLGAIVPFSFIFLPLMLRGYRWVGLLLSIWAGIFYATSHGYFQNESYLNSILRVYFFANGCFVLFLFFSLVFENVKKIYRNFRSLENYQFILLFLWFVGVSVYLISFLSLMAVRHVLIVLPPLFLLFSRYLFPRVRIQILIFGLIISSLFGILLSVSDWIQADVYRTYAPLLYKLIPESENGQRYFSGHWGWQWYAQKHTAWQYDTLRVVFQHGDYIVAPRTESQMINPIHKNYLKLFSVVSVPSTPLIYLRTFTEPLVSPRGYYATGDRYLPYGVFTGPLEEFYIYRVYK